MAEDLLATAAVLAIAGELQNRPRLSFRYPSIRTLATVITVFAKNRQILPRHLVCPTLGTDVRGDASQLPIQPTPLGEHEINLQAFTCAFSAALDNYLGIRNRLDDRWYRGRALAFLFYREQTALLCKEMAKLRGCSF